MKKRLLSIGLSLSLVFSIGSMFSNNKVEALQTYNTEEVTIKNVERNRTPAMFGKEEYDLYAHLYRYRYSVRLMGDEGRRSGFILFFPEDMGDQLNINLSGKRIKIYTDGKYDEQIHAWKFID